MTLKPLGPQAILEKMQQFQAPETALPEPSVEFAPALDGKLTGTISPQGSFAPANPMSGNFSIQSGLDQGQLKGVIERAANENGIDPDLFDALVSTESNYNPLARSNKNAMGLCQLMPDTAAELGVQNPMDPVQNARGGAKYLSQMLNRFGGDVSMALAAYNAGPGAVTKYGGVPPFTETQNYVSRILERYRARKAQ